MIGRLDELNQLERFYNSSKFEFLTMYGRRRIGKTTILREFAGRHKALFFSAQEKNDSLNLLDFSKMVQTFFEGSFISSFQNWEAAFEYITGKISDKKLVLIIDEFPFLAEPNPSIKSILQHTIDHVWKGKNIFLILCGSSVSFMLNDVMGYKSPLYGRITGNMEVKPFDYLESAEFFPNYSKTEKAIAYGILGGVPRYLEAFSSEISLEENIKNNLLMEGAFLNDEPQTLLRIELREPSVYNSILEAISNGCNKVCEIADRIHEEKSKPFTLALVKMHIEAVLKRAGKLRTMVEYNDLQADVNAQLLFYKEQHIPTTRKEFDLMVYFMEHPGIVLPRDTILNAVWEYDYTGDVRTIDTLVKQLRKKMGEGCNYIRTVYGVGYIFGEDIHEN